uniref:Serpentine receptor class gamma n=1 Tax=Panagrellus redivivus TaxID=6233 RepID=A0A7E4VCP5_PANRE
MLMDLACYAQGRILGAPVYLGFAEWLPKDGAVPMIFMFLGYGSIWSGQLLNAMISFNRFSVIYLKMKYAPFWKKNLKYFLIASVLVPFLMSVQFFVSQPAILLYDKTNPKVGYYLMERVDKAIYSKSGRSALLFAFTGVSSFCMNCYVLNQLIKRKKSSTASVSMDDSSAVNPRFLAYNINTFVCECIVAIVQVLGVFIKTGKDNCCIHPVLFVATMFACDLGSLSPAWFMLAVHKQLQEDILGPRFSFKKKIVVAEPSSNASNVLKNRKREGPVRPVNRVAAVK